LDDAIERVPLWSRLKAYEKQHKETTKEYNKHKTQLPVALWPRQKAKGARPRKPAKDTSKSHHAAYDDVVRRHEERAVAEQDLNDLHAELSAAETSEQEAAQSLGQQVEKRKHHHQQGYHHENQMAHCVLNDCMV
jgi:dynactin complex subunit